MKEGEYVAEEKQHAAGSSKVKKSSRRRDQAGAPLSSFSLLLCTIFRQAGPPSVTTEIVRLFPFDKAGAIRSALARRCSAAVKCKSNQAAVAAPQNSRGVESLPTK